MDGSYSIGNNLSSKAGLWYDAQQPSFKNEGFLAP
ncbi:hypothetical protein CCACVL1_23626 [Corchorus capsularis]|uniref:Uncharacterized protein n=1 Tax=Corchorus capsularis TaxID=210143 RepID=A0A1R3GTF4_COCAP|nr:hypothetical protein CCACVL1_23626 [Corchorus capsularis]